jgi:hypothetical protein
MKKFSPKAIREIIPENSIALANLLTIRATTVMEKAIMINHERIMMLPVTKDRTKILNAMNSLTRGSSL